MGPGFGGDGELTLEWRNWQTPRLQIPVGLSPREGSTPSSSTKETGAGDGSRARLEAGRPRKRQRFESARLRHGRMAERLKAPVLKTGVGQTTVGSNPTPSSMEAELAMGPGLIRNQCAPSGVGIVTSGFRRQIWKTTSEWSGARLLAGAHRKVWGSSPPPSANLLL